MNDIWVCSACKSINRQRDERCYRCQERQAAAMPAIGPDPRVQTAVANRLARAYRPTWLFAVIAGGLIAAVAVMGLYLVLEQTAGIAAVKSAFAAELGGQADAANAALLAEDQRLATPALIRGVLTILAVIGFAIWLSLVTLNVPALGGGTPSRSPMKALIYPLIPILNLVKVPGMIQDALYRVDPRAGGFFMVAVAWFGLVAAGSCRCSATGGSPATASRRSCEPRRSTRRSGSSATSSTRRTPSPS
jgi:hypothetical protein